MPSTFNSPVVGSAYYYTRRHGTRSVCRSSGFELLYSLQVSLRTALEALGTLPSAGGASVSFDQIGVIDIDNPAAGPGWNDATLRGLYAYAQHGNARSVLTTIAEDIMRRSGTLSERTMKAAMWVLDSAGFDAAGVETYGLGSPDEISFDPNTVFPTYGQIPPVPTNRHAALRGTCIPIAEGASANDPITTTATFGASPWLIVALLGATVIAIGVATRGERSNPTPRDDEEEFRRRQALPGVRTVWAPSPQFEEITLTRHGQYVGMRKKSHRDGYVTHSLPPLQKEATR